VISRERYELKLPVRGNQWPKPVSRKAFARFPILHSREKVPPRVGDEASSGNGDLRRRWSRIRVRSGYYQRKICLQRTTDLGGSIWRSAAILMRGFGLKFRLIEQKMEECCWLTVMGRYRNWDTQNFCHFFSWASLHRQKNWRSLLLTIVQTLSLCQSFNVHFSRQATDLTWNPRKRNGIHEQQLTMSSKQEILVCHEHGDNFSDTGSQMFQISGFYSHANMHKLKP
jgi:hypothetical protein